MAPTRVRCFALIDSGSGSTKDLCRQRLATAGFVVVELGVTPALEETDGLGVLVMLAVLAVPAVLVVPCATVMEAVPLVAVPTGEETDIVADGVATPKTMSYCPTEGVGTLNVHTVLLSSILRASMSAWGISSAPAPGIPRKPNFTPGVSVENSHTALS